MLVGGFDLECNNEKFRGPKESAKKLMKSIFFLRNNANRLSDKDAEKLVEIVKDCSMKLNKIIERLEEEN